MKIELLTSVWGSAHIEMMRRALLNSLTFERNKMALYGAKWNIFTDEEHMVQIKNMCEEALPDTEISIGTTSMLRRYIDITQSAVVWQVEECLKNGSRLLMAPPDTIFGNGTIENLKMSGREKHTCVVVPHPRVIPSFLNTSDIYYRDSNAHLVDAAWNFLHRSWTDAEEGHHMQNSFVGGVVWKEIEEGLYEVRHRLPTIYLADFTKEDLEVFKSMPSFGSYDHEFPSRLVHQGRQRFVASSDACFIIEITDPNKNVPPIWDGPVTEFWRSHPHGEHDKQILSYFRSE